MVQAKSKAVATWIGYANRHAAANGGKSWKYLLVSQDRVTESSRLSGLSSSFTLPMIEPGEDKTVHLSTVGRGETESVLVG